jgi:hypothetical protein
MIEIIDKPISVEPEATDVLLVADLDDLTTEIKTPCNDDNPYQ